MLEFHGQLIQGVIWLQGGGGRGGDWSVQIHWVVTGSQIHSDWRFEGSCEDTIAWHKLSQSRENIVIDNSIYIYWLEGEPMIILWMVEWALGDATLTRYSHLTRNGLVIQGMIPQLILAMKVSTSELTIIFIAHQQLILNQPRRTRLTWVTLSQKCVYL